jgi:branched-chain amino acid aminotransferase
MSSTLTRTRALPDWDSLTFAFTETDWIYRSLGDTERDLVWDAGAIAPYGGIELTPAAAVLSYGLGIFEGLKAFRREDGAVQLFRPDMNAVRFQRSAERLALAPFPAGQFVDACARLVDANREWVPPYGKGTFYIRPMEHATEARLGFGRCRAFAVTMYGSPVGAVKTAGTEGLRLRVVEQARVAPGGTGAAKAMGNYAGGVFVADPWKRQGFDDVLYLDARETAYVTETSGANLFAVLKDGRLVTPPLDDQIMPGVTRDSAIVVARTLLGLTVEERRLGVEELLTDAVEVFCTGTAWTVRSVREIAHRDRTARYARQDVCAQLWEVISGVQSGRRDDPFGWTREVPRR